MSLLYYGMKNYLTSLWKKTVSKIKKVTKSYPMDYSDTELISMHKKWISTNGYIRIDNNTYIITDPFKTQFPKYGVRTLEGYMTPSGIIILHYITDNIKDLRMVNGFYNPKEITLKIQENEGRAFEQILNEGTIAEIVEDRRRC